MRCKKTICLLLVIATIVTAFAGCGNNNQGIYDTTTIEFTNAQLNEIDAEIDEILNVNDYYGAARVKLNKNDVYSNYSGFENNFGDKINENTVFHGGSITRTFTGIAIYKLIDQNKLTLDTPLSKFFDGGEYLSETTIKQLLNTTVCLTSYFTSVSNNPVLMKKISAAYKKNDDERIKRLIEAEIISNGPGSRKDSAISNYYILGLIIEKVTGKSYKQFIKSEFIDKLGLKNTGFIKTGGKLKSFDVNNNRWRNQKDLKSWSSYGFWFSTYGITTSADDVVKLCSAILDGTLCKTDLIKAIRGSNYNCGIYCNGRYYVVTSKTYLGAAYIRMNPEDLETVVLISNYTGRTDVSETGKKITQTIKTKINGIILDSD